MGDSIHLWTILNIDETRIPELKRLEYLLNELQQQTYNENKMLNDSDALIRILDILCKNYFTLFKNLDIKKRKLFIQTISNKLEPIEKELEHSNQTLNALYEQKQLLTNLCLFKFNIKPLMFTKQALRYRNMPNELESELIKLIDEMRRKYPNILNDILDKEYREIKNNLREKIVITVLGSTKSSKSSFINFLLQCGICPTGNKEATARLTKIIYGREVRVTLISSLGKPMDSFVFNNKEELRRKVKELIVLKDEDRKSNLCEDEVIIELPIDELENVELWDIPGFDENVVINNRITAILKDTDLILAVLPQQESLRKTAIDFIKPCLVQNDIPTSEYKNKPITKICFIISQIDKFKPDEQSKESKEDFLQHIYEKIRKELPTNFPDANYKTSNQFIPMCSSYVHSVKDHLECRKEFIQKSCQWFDNALRHVTYRRTDLLLKSIKEFSNYDNIFHQQARYERTQQIFNNRFSLFSNDLAENVKKKLDEVFLIINESINDIVSQCLIFFTQNKGGENIEEYIQMQLTNKFNEVLTNKNPDMIQMIEQLFSKFSNAIQLKPPEIQILKQALDNTLITTPYQSLIEQYQHSSSYHLSNYFKQICRALLDTIKDVVNLHEDGRKGQKVSKIFVTHKKYFEQEILNSITDLVKEIIEELAYKLHSETQKILREFLFNHLQHIQKGIQEKIQKYIHSTADNTKIDYLRQFFKENSMKIKRMHLDILTIQFDLDYGSTLKINENERLDQTSNFRVYAGTLGQKNKPIAAKLIPLNDFRIQEVLYIRELKHENVIRYCGVKKYNENNYYIIMPRLDCDLLTYLKENTRKLDSISIDGMIKQIIKGVNYIHTELDLVHRDIKLQNILVNKTSNAFLIADLGGVHQEPITCIYSEGYAAPELLSRGMITDKCDIYSLGIVMQHIIKLGAIEQNNDALINYWLKISKICCSTEPSDRPSCKILLEKDFSDV